MAFGERDFGNAGLDDKRRTTRLVQAADYYNCPVTPCVEQTSVHANFGDRLVIILTILMQYQSYSYATSLRQKMF